MAILPIQNFIPLSNRALPTRDLPLDVIALIATFLEKLDIAAVSHHWKQAIDIRYKDLFSEYSSNPLILRWMPSDPGDPKNRVISAISNIAILLAPFRCALSHPSSLIQAIKNKDLYLFFQCLWIDINPQKKFPFIENLEQQTAQIRLELPQMKKELAELDLAEFQDAGLTSIPPEITYLENVESIDFSNNQIREIGPHLGTLQNLTHVNFDSNYLKSLVPLKPLAGLKHLFLERNRIGNEGLSSLKYFEDLKELDLSRNRITLSKEQILLFFPEALRDELEITSDEIESPSSEKREET
jgi:hypothetical protein